MASVTLKGLCKRFSGVTVVRDVNLDIADREFLVLVGPSGCGKTTTLRMVAGLEEISEGEIRIGERVVNDLAPKDRDIAMVFQNYALYPHMNVFENMAFGLKLRRLPREEIDRRVRDAAEVLGLSDLLKRKPKELSGGQRQRVALGRAIVRDPAVFLMDEPLSNLDAKLRVQMRTELKKLHRRLETTIIYVTHDQTEAMTMGDRIAVMKDGRVHQCGSPREIYERPADLFVAGFIGSPAMNFLRGRVRYEGGRPFLVSDAAEGNGGFRILLPQRESLMPDREVVLGVRPEDVQIDAAPDSEALQATVELVEPVGSETYLYARRGPHLLTLRVSTQTRVAVGDAVALHLPPERSHVFDAETERAYA